MRSSLVAIALLSSWSRTAAADDAPWVDRADSELREDVPRPLTGELALTDARFTWRLDADAGISGQGTRATGGAGLAQASAGGELAITGEGCDVLVLGGQADLRSDRDDVAVQQWGALCPISGAFTMRIDHRLEWGVTPRLLAPPRLRAEGTWRETIGIGYAIRIGTDLAPSGDRHVLEAADVRMAPTVSWVPGRPDLIDLSVVADMSFLRFVTEPADDGPRREVRLIEAHVEAAPMSSGTLAMTFELDGLRLEGWRVAGVTWGAALGLGAADVEVPNDPQTAMEPAGVQVLDHAEVLAGTFALHGERNLGSLIAAIDVDRALWPTWDGHAVIDDRVTASVRGARGRWRGRVDAVAARGHVLSIDGLRSAPRGGVSVDVERELGAHLVARGHVEAGKSVYAPGATFAAPAWGAEASVSLGLHAGNR